MEKLTDEELAELSNDAVWMHSQMLQGAAMGLSAMFAAGGSSQAPQRPQPRRPGGARR